MIISYVAKIIIDFKYSSGNFIICCMLIGYEWLRILVLNYKISSSAASYELKVSSWLTSSALPYRAKSYLTGFLWEALSFLLIYPSHLIWFLLWSGPNSRCWNRYGNQICVLVTTWCNDTSLCPSSDREEDVVELCVGLGQEHPEGVHKLSNTELVLGFKPESVIIAMMHCLNVTIVRWGESVIFHSFPP